MPGVCTVLLGWDTGIHYFLLVFMPAVAVSRSPQRAVATLGLILAAYLDLDVTARAIHYYVERVSEAERRLRRMASTDPLSGLSNRRRVLDAAHGERQRGGAPLAVKLADIDEFKRINDRLGHEAGDEVIRHVSALLRRQLRAGGLIGRRGGEEFIAFLPADEAGAIALCERMREALAATPCATGAGPVSLDHVPRRARPRPRPAARGGHPPRGCGAPPCEAGRPQSRARQHGRGRRARLAGHLTPVRPPTDSATAGATVEAGRPRPHLGRVMADVRPGGARAARRIVADPPLDERNPTAAS